MNQRLYLHHRQAGILVPTETIDRVVGYLRDQVWNDDKKKHYPHRTPMAIIILATPHRYIPVYQQ